jgi:hypothetical protein
MTPTEELLRAELDRAYPATATAPDWSEVLRRLPAAPARPRRRRLGVAALALAAAAAAALALGAPWRHGPTFADRALAAIGHDRYVVAVLEPVQPSVSVVDLATGRTRPLRERTVTIVDSGSASSAPNTSGWITLGGVVTGVFTQGNPENDPAVASFAAGYRKALADGSATVAGKTTYRGRPARILRFSFDQAVEVRPGTQVLSPVAYPHGRTEDVAVDTATFRPLWVRWTDTVVTVDGGTRRVRRVQEPTYRVVSIGSRPTAPTLPQAAHSDEAETRPALRQVTRAGAARVLGARARWLGPLGLRSVELEQVFSLQGQAASGFGLRFVYAHGLEVRESTRPGPYGYWIPGLLPPEGKALASCEGCGPWGVLEGKRAWTFSLRSGPMYVSVTAPTRDLALGAAQQLRAMP